jgi:hypothetical protein
MPKLLRARPPFNAVEERRVRKLAGSRHAPGDWIRRAQMIARSWDGLRTLPSRTNWVAIPRRCANGCCDSMPRGSMVSGIVPARDAGHG